MCAIGLAIAMIFIKTFGQVDARERDENFDGVSVLENIWKPDHVLESLNLSSKLTCGAKCMDLLHHGPCQSFGWNTIKRQCLLYTKPYYSTPTSGVMENGWQHFNVKGKVCGDICSRQKFMPVLATHIVVLKDIYMYILSG